MLSVNHSGWALWPQPLSDLCTVTVTNAQSLSLGLCPRNIHVFTCALVIFPALCGHLSTSLTCSFLPCSGILPFLFASFIRLVLFITLPTFIYSIFTLYLYIAFCSTLVCTYVHTYIQIYIHKYSNIYSFNKNRKDMIAPCLPPHRCL